MLFVHSYFLIGIWMYLVNSPKRFSIDISSYWSSLRWTMMSLISSKLNHNDNLGLSSTLLIFDTLNFWFKTICRLNLFVFIWEDSHIKTSLLTSSVICSWCTFIWKKIFFSLKTGIFSFFVVFNARFLSETFGFFGVVCTTSYRDPHVGEDGGSTFTRNGLWWNEHLVSWRIFLVWRKYRFQK